MDSPPSLTPRATDRLFFGIFPPKDVSAQIEALALGLRRRHGLRGKAHAPERSHVTLVFLGDHIGFPDRIVEAASAAATRVSAAPFQVVFDHAASFDGRPKNRPFVLRGGEGLSALGAMRAQLHAALLEAGAPAGPAAFTPHVTLLYDDKAVAETPVPPVCWTVDAFVLVRSRIGQGVQDRLATWTLG